MKKFLVMALIAVVSAAGLALAPAPSAQAAPKKQCIYMVQDVQPWSFAYMVWKKRGKKIVGVTGGYPGHYEKHWLTYQPKKRRAVGKQENSTWPYGPAPRYSQVTFKTNGPHKRPVARGWTRVGKWEFDLLTGEERVGLRGCRA